MQKKFIYRSISVAYQVSGQGNPVVLLHGFGEDSSVWIEQVNFLQSTCQLIVPDIPGSGSSELLRGDHISIEDYADCIHALLQEEGISQCTMLGHSMGGYITLAFVEKYPQMLTGFGLIHSTAFADSDEKKKTRDKGIAFIREHGGYAFLKTSIPGLFGADFKKEHADKVAAFIEASSAFSNEALIQYYEAMKLRPDRSHVLKSNPLAVLFVTGTEDIAAPLNDVLKQSHLPDKSYIHVLPGAGHMGMWEAAQPVNDFIAAFVNR